MRCFGYYVWSIQPGLGFLGMGQLQGAGYFALITVLAFTMQKPSVVKVIGYSLGSSIIFYLLSNLFLSIDNPVYHTYSQDAKVYLIAIIM